MTTDAKLLSAEDFVLLPGPPEGGRMELVNGEVVTMPPAGGEHGRRSATIAASLLRFIREHVLGDVGVEVGYLLRRDPDILRAPDASFLRADRLEGGRFPASYVVGAPTLAVEVVSPGDTADEVNAKVTEYLEAGAERVWVVQPNVRRVIVHWPNGDAHTYGPGDVLTSREAAFPLDGFELPIDEIFA